MKKLLILVAIIAILSVLFSCRHDANENSKFIVTNIVTDSQGTYYEIRDIELIKYYTIRDTINKFQLNDTIEFTVKNK